MPTMPSMSWPRCVCASKMSAPAGNSSFSFASKETKLPRARSTGSLTLEISPRDLFERRREHTTEKHPLGHRAVPLRRAVDDDSWNGPDVHRIRECRELRRLDRRGADPG